MSRTQSKVILQVKKGKSEHLTTTTTKRQPKDTNDEIAQKLRLSDKDTL